jgi:hypothetical protein
MSSIMLFKTLTLHSLIYIAGITTSLAVHQAIPLPVIPAGPQSSVEQSANRLGKSDRLPLVQSKRKAPDKMPARLQARDPLKPDSGVCKHPIDVPGRCFAQTAPMQRLV